MRVSVGALRKKKAHGMKKKKNEQTSVNTQKILLSKSDNRTYRVLCAQRAHDEQDRMFHCCGSDTEKTFGGSRVSAQCWRKSGPRHIYTGRSFLRAHLSPLKTAAISAEYVSSSRFSPLSRSPPPFIGCRSFKKRM